MAPLLVFTFFAVMQASAEAVLEQCAAQGAACSGTCVGSSGLIQTKHATYKQEILTKAAYANRPAEVVKAELDKHLDQPTPADSLVFVAILSKWSDVSGRASLRTTWQHARLGGLNVTRKFAICHDSSPDDAPLHDRSTQTSTLVNEAAAFNDLLILPCREGYRNLSDKLFRIMQVYHDKYSHSIPFFMKVDSDTFVDWPKLVDFIERAGGPNVYVGVNVSDDKVVRNSSCAWHETYETFPNATYPWTMAGGPGYILGRGIVKHVLLESTRARFLHNEDRALAVGIQTLKERGLPVQYINIPGTNGYSYKDLAQHCQHPDLDEQQKLQSRAQVPFKTWQEYPYILHHHLNSRSIQCLTQAALDNDKKRKMEMCFPEQIISSLRRAANPQRPVLTAGLLGRNGNILFEIAALLSVAIEARGQFSVSIPTSSNHHNTSFPLGGQFFSKLAPLIEESPSSVERDYKHVVEHWGPAGRSINSLRSLPDNGNWAAAIAKSLPCQAQDCDETVVVQLKGYFQDAKYFTKHIDFLRELFVDETKLQDARQRLNRLVLRVVSKDVVSIHYRFGDYTTQAEAYKLPQQYYQDAIQKVSRFIASNLTCLVFSDDPQLAEDWSRHLSQCSKRIVVRDVDDVTSFFMMSLVPNSIIADSTFSFWAAILGVNKSLVVSPATEDWKFGYLKNQPGWATVPTALQ